MCRQARWTSFRGAIFDGNKEEGSNTEDRDQGEGEAFDKENACQESDRQEGQSQAISQESCRKEVHSQASHSQKVGQALAEESRDEKSADQEEVGCDERQRGQASRLRSAGGLAGVDRHDRHLRPAERLPNRGKRRPTDHNEKGRALARPIALTGRIPFHFPAFDAPFPHRGPGGAWGSSRANRG